MKKKLFIFLAVLAVVTCICAISVSAVTPNNDGEVFVAADGTTLALYDTEGKALAWFYDSANSTYVPYRVGIDFTMALNSGRELVPSTVISDTDGDANTTFPYTVSNMILLNGRDYSAFTYISGTWQNLPIQAIYVNNKFAWINKTAFNNNNTLKVFDIPKDHTGTLHIGAAFVKANALESFYIPKQAYFESTSTFEYSTGIKFVEFHKEWTGQLKGYEFNSCTALETVILADTATSIPTKLCYNCSSLTSVNVPSGVTTISSESFRNCTSLASITIPEDVTLVDNYAFAGAGLVTITFESKGDLVKFGNAVFERCKSLTRLEIPEGVTYLGNCFANGCSKLNYLSLPSTLETMYDNSHFRDTALTTFIGLENTKLVNIPYHAFRGAIDANIGTLKLPNTVETIGQYAFADCYAEVIILSANLKTFSSSEAFVNCPNLKAVYVPGTITNFGTSTFNNGKTSNFSFFVTSTDATYLETVKSKFGCADIVTYETYSKDESAYAKGKHVISGYNSCEAFYNGHLNGGEETGAWTGDKFLSNYQITCPCGRNCGVVTVVKELEPLFVSKGYSMSGSAMMQAFAINKSLWESEYSVLFPELKYGMVAAYKGANDSGFDTTSGKIVNTDCTGINTKVAVVDMTERDYDIFEIKISGVGAEDHKAKTFFLCAYVVLDDTVYYIDNGTTGESATGASYNDVEAFVSPEYGYVGKEEE